MPQSRREQIIRNVITRCQAAISPTTVLRQHTIAIPREQTPVLLVAALIGGIWTLHKARTSTFLRHTRQELANDRALLEDDKS